MLNNRDTYVKEKKKIKEDKDFILDYYALEDGDLNVEDDEMEGAAKTIHNYSRKYDITEECYVDADELEQSSSGNVAYVNAQMRMTQIEKVPLRMTILVSLFAS